jgi:hypothetical protein
VGNRVRGVALAGLIATVLTFAPTADAALNECTTDGGATNLATAIANATPGATVTVDPGPCVAPAGGYTIANKAITLQGSEDSIIDGTNLNVGTRILTLNSAGTTAVRDLTFMNGTKNGAVSTINDTAPTFERVSFFGGNAVNGAGLALSSSSSGQTVVRDSTFGSTASNQGNSSTQGAGLYAQLDSGSLLVEGSRFSGNGAEQGAGLFASADGTTVTGSTFSDNVAETRGGGAYIEPVTGSTLTLAGNRFASNRLFDGTPSPANVTHNGAGLFVKARGSVSQTGNVFDANSMTYGFSTGDSSGAGEYVAHDGFSSRGDRFTGNQLQVADTGGEAEGAGLAIEGCVPTGDAGAADNLVATANSFTGPGTGERSGAGVYVGCGGGPASLTLNDSTIAGNSSGGGTAGLFGGSDDNLTLQNTIVAGNSGGVDLSGFASKTASFSDACPLLGGAGNFCANPLLTADAHETAASPTIDKGTNALVPAGLTTDFEGQARIRSTAVDIGADEVQADAPADNVAPGVTGASLTNKAFAVGKGATAITARKKKRKVKRGTTIRYTLSEAAAVRLTIERASKGRRVKRGKKRVCAKPTRKNRKKKRCTRYKRAGKTLVRSSKAGKNKVKFSGRIAKKALKSGSYRLTIVATDGAGNRSKAKRLKFRIVKP